VAATLFNSGKHLYWDQSWPRWYNTFDQPLFFLPFREFSEFGGNLGSVRIQHMGHLYGVLGGIARVGLDYRGIHWNLQCEPLRLYYLVDFDGPQAWFASQNFVKLPRELLSHG